MLAGPESRVRLPAGQMLVGQSAYATWVCRVQKRL